MLAHVRIHLDITIFLVIWFLMENNINLTTASQGFAAVGSEPRLEVVLALVRAGPDGLTIGEIQDRLAIPASTLAHHIRFLTAAGLVSQEKQGRSIINRAAYDQLEALAGFLLRECCEEAGGSRHEKHNITKGIPA